VSIWRAAAGLSAAIGLCGCLADATTVVSSYDPLTRELLRIDVDTNRDGVIDSRTYMRGTVAYRTEVDGNGDGRIDRWEYLANGVLQRVGSASAGDGIEDTWAAVATVDGERRVERALHRDRRAARHEFYREEVMVRAEEDSNGDGLIDKWEVFEGGRLRSVSFDSTFAAGRADRRLVYSAEGQFDHVEADLDGDGTFTRH
jgi:hypothetical protein